jgi:HD superfamily phosphohydrolase
MSAPFEADSRTTAKVVRDPIHNYVAIRPELLPLVNHPFVQRLRRIAQTSLSAIVYPSMTGRRFEHSLGAMHLAGRAWRMAWSNTSNEVRQAFRADVSATLAPFRSSEERSGARHLNTLISEDTSDEQFVSSLDLAISAVALLHDIGHPPFSHALEEWYEYNLEWIVAALGPGSRTDLFSFRDHLTGHEFHEVIGLHLTERIEDSVRDVLPWEVVRSILWASVHPSGNGDRTWSACLYELVAGEVDVDRLDYLVRDTHNSGTEFGSFDIERLLQSLELHKLEPQADDAVASDPHPASGWSIVFGARATSALESFINQRFQYYRWVVFHHHVVAANRMLNQCLHYLLRLEGVLDGEGRLIGSTEGGQQFNYFAPVATQVSAVRNRDIAGPDDGTVVEWIKSGLSTYRYESDERGATDAPVIRFVALADAVIHRTPNWISIWKTDGDYRLLSQTLFGALKFAFNNARLKFDAWKTGRPANIVAIAENRFAEIARLIEPLQFPREMPVPRASVPYVPGGPVPFMNKIAEVILSSDEALGNFRFRREVEAANLFTTIAGTADGHEYGFWVFAYDKIVPWRLGARAAKVFKGDRFVALSEESGYALHWLEGVEAERSQFHCYFVSPTRDSYSPEEIADIRERFRRAYPKFVYNALLQMFGIPG